MVTAELAATLPAVVFVLAVLLSAAMIGIDQVRCVDAARAVARAAARGDPIAESQAVGARAAPRGARIVVDLVGDNVRVTVSSAVPGPFGWLAGGHRLGSQAEAVREQS